jgi:hypothetical protein
MFSFFFTACKKDDGSSSSPSQSLLKSYTETQFAGTPISVSTTYNLAYDENNRLLGLTDSKDPGNKFVFSYVQGGFDFDIYGAGTPVIHRKVFMNGALTDSSFQYNNEGDTTSEKYVYWAGNLLKYLMTYKVTSSGSQLDNVTEYTYGANDELIREQDYYSTTLYDYYTTEINNFDLYPVYVNRSKQLPGKVTYRDGVEVISWKHKYNFDAQHRLITDSIDVSNSSYIVVKKFTYE